MEKGKEELQNYLPNLSAKGSQDDISIGGILVKKELMKKMKDITHGLEILL